VASNFNLKKEVDVMEITYVKSQKVGAST
jgi:hypothetical protein